MAALVIAGFAPEHLQRMQAGVSIAPIVAVHASIMVVWMLFVAAQSSLPAMGRTDLHRKAGWFGAGLAATVIVLGLIITFYGVIHGRNPAGGAPQSPFATPAQFAIVPFRDIATFAPFVVLALIWRRSHPLAHKRLMTLATVTLMPAALTRIELGGPPILATAGGLFTMIALLAVHDLMSLRRVHPATWIGGLAILASIPASPRIANTDAWLWFVERLT